MSLLGKWIAPWYSGLAFSKFSYEKYEAAARLFEKVCRLDPSGDRMELIYACLGRCYLALEKHDQALEMLSRAYEAYQKRDQAIEEDFERREYRQFLKAYSMALTKAGQNDTAAKVARQLEDMKN